MRKSQRPAGHRVLVLLAALLPFLAGCSTSRPPYVVVFHSYFPSWIPCAIGGCIAAVLLRVILVRRGLDEYLPLHLLTYLAFAAAVMFMLSLLIFAR